MRLYGLLLTLSLVLADDNNEDVCDQCSEDYENNTNSSIPAGLPEIQCFVYNVNLLSCSWSTDSLPEDAQFSASYQYCNKLNHNPLNCELEESKKWVKCQSRITKHSPNEMAINISISKNGDWYTVCKHKELGEIEKLDPPRNITASVNSGNLEIQWVRPESCCSQKCFLYELKINNEIKKLELESDMLNYTYENIKPTSHYTIQIRTKHDPRCLPNDHWGDWSKAVVIGPEISDNPSTSVIICIAFVLPMILLAILLLCKFQRLTEKLFPSIPNPSKSVKSILEKNDFNPVIPQKQIEEHAVFLEVTG